jgi:hypothetical protein
MMARPRGQTAKLNWTNLLPDDGNPAFPNSDFLFALYGVTSGHEQEVETMSYRKYVSSI